MAAGLATLEQLAEPAYAWLNGTGDRVRAQLAELGKRYGVPLRPTGIGSLFKIHFSEVPIRDYRATLKGSPILHTALFLFGMNRGVFISETGRDCLSLAMGEAEIELYFGVLEEFLRELSA
jgi:glutamate-1-semialdehyde 2,1-aminomutase